MSDFKKHEWKQNLLTGPVLEWLLDSDPAVRWQVMRDLLHEPEDKVAAVRSQVAVEGWGQQVLSRQSEEGHWWADEDAWPLQNTLFALVLLKDMGLEPKSAEAGRAVALVRDRLIWEYHEGRSFFEGEVEACINGRILAAGAYYGEVSERLVQYLLDGQLADGGWNCEAPPSTRSSFHSTICVLEGLLEYEKAAGADPAVTAARKRGEEYILERGLFRSLSSGGVIDSRFTCMFYPPSYHYDILRGLEYFRLSGTRPDKRMSEAVGLILAKQAANGRWPLDSPRPDHIPFHMEDPSGGDSRWNTLRALRVLKWWSSY
ncbi:hypothetical protein [Paenibacillus sp. DMB5]|uniref:hypothetical protein n=1 Tax=Paenibacillus sp. DMB5 TaxID=1780103 RepID=UPI00076DA033|nr:hypothetical protein [Paenibacillus sp. DMB5]KUP23566.1 hypothetical protein AWJ19_08800 [Paenibacillus sp. DMB5]KUP25039.1 hypothetical protein AWJ19_04965 [Paenibacillus sp. DMB5]